ncbi:uncharacterized protein [Miscanthus floridulus]|uniref:uncharacterized protein n=1 Tax=Miscanthus floridulus TaxID=154761 RepID=UPI00345B04E0
MKRVIIIFVQSTMLFKNKNMHCTYFIKRRGSATNIKIPAFKECWYEHAEVKLDLENFSVVYPPVPKQRNINDCVTFAIMFMEFVNNDTDLRCFFDQSDIPNIRVKLGNALFFSKKKFVDKTLVQNFLTRALILASVTRGISNCEK